MPLPTRFVIFPLIVNVEPPVVVVPAGRLLHAARIMESDKRLAANRNLNVTFIRFFLLALATTSGTRGVEGDYPAFSRLASAVFCC
jgi:hypothetical protein